MKALMPNSPSGCLTSGGLPAKATCNCPPAARLPSTRRIDHSRIGVRLRMSAVSSCCPARAPAGTSPRCVQARLSAAAQSRVLSRAECSMLANTSTSTPGEPLRLASDASRAIDGAVVANFFRVAAGTSLRPSAPLAGRTPSDGWGLPARKAFAAPWPGNRGDTVPAALPSVTVLSQHPWDAAGGQLAVCARVMSLRPTAARLRDRGRACPRTARLVLMRDAGELPL